MLVHPVSKINTISRMDILLYFHNVTLSLIYAAQHRYIVNMNYISIISATKVCLILVNVRKHLNLKN